MLTRELLAKVKKIELKTRRLVDEITGGAYHSVFKGRGIEFSEVREYTPEEGQTNPFLHMGLHLAIREQVATDRPAGIALVHRSLAARLGDVHEAEHAMIERLGAALWNAQRAGLPPDEAQYLESLRRLL